MNARKFIAASSREALKLVRIELGEDAVILSNRKVPEGVEIVAVAGSELAHLSETRVSGEVAPKQQGAQRVPVPEGNTSATKLQPRSGRLTAQAENQAAALGAKILEANSSREAVAVPGARDANAEQKILLSEIKSMRNLMQEQLARLSWSDMQQRDPARGGLLRDMLNAGFSPMLSRQLLEKIPADGGLDWLRRILGHNLRVATVQEDVVARGGVYALVGPTGVGKTTTTAKMAARAVVRYGADKVALVTTDSYRIGAHEQLKIYGKILGVSVHAVRDTEDLKLTLSGLKHKHLVLIDTMGVGQRDSRVAEQAQMFDTVGVQRLLLLNATSSGGTLEDVVKMYGGTGVIGCIPTKLDEAVTLGTVLDVVVRHKLTMHYVASGQRVPEDLHEVNLEYLLHRVFKDVGKSSAAFAMQETELPAFMAGIGSAQAMRGQYAL
ncbi:flagellar biosynthesis protein FlhF [Sideroxydans lithotrophicus]|uniref:Flagellar biosynthesis protein FlhF n=1 Tax=Sideroxydans lithotrophicus (strain ES-1) TaxID=580332 RepID=D5CMW1_SIDLE|nr:flagellar biosynthesis protein FlhF [Sideroxydans lithotrophicus]ADE10797.1 flagellar biosynthetic protein FlhF [Sideroxydans lithotrophicus ES-1]